MKQRITANTDSKGESNRSTAMPDLGGFRMTRQRRVVYDVLTEELDHPTASEVFIRSKGRMPGISLATVYNCLETLTQAGIVRQVNVDRDASRFCPNLMPHAHFFCSQCHQVFDIGLKRSADAVSPWKLPKGSTVDDIDVAMKGCCPDCGKEAKAESKGS
jgi:Fe2+ or Zn2+ uptake regulation protein